MTFDDDFAELAWPDLCEQFGETIIYKPYGDLAREITAIVNRVPPTSIPGVGGGFVVPKLTITVENHATRGISSAEIDTGKDLVEIAVRAGQTARELKIGNPLNDDGGALVIPVY